MPTILIVDDESSVRYLTLAAVKMRIEGATFILAENADTAEQALTSNHVDILISDINLTTYDPNGGFRVIAKAREVKGQEIIIIAMSQGDFEVKSLKAGANRFSPKRYGEKRIARLAEMLWRNRTK